MRANTCYLYVLPLIYEDILKVGISGDPLARAQAFSRRYYECFDLQRSLLVEFGSKREAQARETELHRQLRLLNATQPLTIQAQAAGETEWYRGAYALLCDEVERDRRCGNFVHAPSVAWWRQRLGEEREALYEWASNMLREADDQLPPVERLQLLADALDAYPCLDVPLDDVLPLKLAHWYDGYRAAWQ
jgi:hypothetical protein